MKKNCLWVFSLLLAGQQALADSATLRGPDIDGRPQIEITGSGKYFIFHAVDDDRVGCDPAHYIDVADSANKHWCRSFNAYASGTTVSDPLPFDVVADNSPLEVEYKVGTSANVNSAEYIGWSPKKPRDPLVDPDPLQSWLQTLQGAYGVTFPTGTLAAIKTSSEQGNTFPVAVTYHTFGRSWLFYFNNKYVALFNHQGALLGLTHTAYGEELIDTTNYVPTSSNDNLRGFGVDTTDGVRGPTNFPSPTLNPNGSLTAIWTNLHSLNLDVRVDWNLTSRYSDDSPPGLQGHARVQDTNPALPSATRLYFPMIYGLATGSGRQVFVPRSNAGSAYPARTSTSSSLLVSGNYPTPSWQSPVLVFSKSATAAVMISANDPVQRPKGFSVADLEPTTTLAGRTMISTLPQNGSTDVIETSGTVTIAPLYGNWMAGVGKYRRWIDRQTWGAGSTPLPVNAARNVDAKLKKGVYWWSEPAWGSNDPLRPSAFAQDAARQKDLIGPTSTGGGVDVGFHLYSWWDQNFDTNYPQYIPTLDGTPPTFPSWVVPPSPLPTVAKTWAQSIGAVQSDTHTLVAPYINAVGIDASDAPSNSTGLVRDTTKCPVDTSGKGWWTHNFPFGSGTLDLKTLAVRKRSDNTPYFTCFGTRAFVYGDPGSSVWQSIVTSNMNTVFGTLQSNGIYLDSFANANYSYDRAATPSGEGDWVRTGTRSLGDMAHTVAGGSSGTRKFIASEYFSELTVPYVDIVMNYENPDPRGLPIIQSMFNQNQLFAGQRVKDSQSVVARKALVGRSFVWGYQLGLAWYRYMCGYTNPDCLDPGSLELLGYVRTLVEAREAVQDPSVGLVWSDAKLVGMADGIDTFTYSGANDWCDDPGNPSDGSCNITLSRLRGAFWSSTGTDLADFLVITNVSGDPIESTFTLPPYWKNAQIVYGTGTNLDPGSNDITVAGNSVVVFRANVSTDVDTDADGIVDASDDDDDNDGVDDDADAFPRQAAASVDTDGDGEPDSWNSGCDANCQAGFGEPLDTDKDDDGVINGSDNCPLVYNDTQTDINTNGVGDACEHGLTASYFNDSDTNASTEINEFDAKLVPPAVLQRIEANIDFSLAKDGTGSPGSGVNADYFSARWTGRLIVPSYTGSYQFCILGDDGIRLWVNDTQILNFWIPQDSVPRCASISLVAGQSVPIRAEFFDLTEEAIMRMTWSWPGQASQVVPSSRLYAE